MHRLGADALFGDGAIAMLCVEASIREASSGENTQCAASWGVQYPKSGYRELRGKQEATLEFLAGSLGEANSVNFSTG